MTEFFNRDPVDLALLAEPHRAAALENDPRERYALRALLTVSSVSMAAAGPNKRNEKIFLAGFWKRIQCRPPTMPHDSAGTAQAGIAGPPPHRRPAGERIRLSARSGQPGAAGAFIGGVGHRRFGAQGCTPRRRNGR
ncbi:hypothetical protein ACFFJ7_18880 [Pseudochelatococcus lubricantis]|uniref:hypothetical protein n=1 Tax=Pseudochelatococcus lubricantis TaxID=1538102 RepID=UPI0035E89C85